MEGDVSRGDGVADASLTSVGDKIFVAVWIIRVVRRGEFAPSVRAVCRGVDVSDEYVAVELRYGIARNDERPVRERVT